jgi:hypothetical protein
MPQAQTTHDAGAHILKEVGKSIYNFTDNIVTALSW